MGNEHICNKEVVIDQMAKKINDVHSALFMSDNSSASLISRVKVLEDIAINIKSFLEKFTDLSYRLANLERDIREHIEEHKKASDRTFKWVFWSVTLFVTGIVGAFGIWILRGGLHIP